MAYTQEHVDALKEAIALGATEVTHNGKTVKYRSLTEMRSVLRSMEADLQASSQSRAPRYYAPTFDKGYQ